jgi:hypothetical protein
VYDRYSYLPELAAALARWSNHVLTVIEDQQPKDRDAERANSLN